MESKEGLFHCHTEEVYRFTISFYFYVECSAFHWMLFEIQNFSLSAQSIKERNFQNKMFHSAKQKMNVETAAL